LGGAEEHFPLNGIMELLCNTLNGHVLIEETSNAFTVRPHAIGHSCNQCPVNIKCPIRLWSSPESTIFAAWLLWLDSLRHQQKPKAGSCCHSGRTGLPRVSPALV